MSSRLQENTSPLDASLALAQIDSGESDGGVWPDLQELFPECAGDEGDDVLALDSALASVTKDCDRDAASTPQLSERGVAATLKPPIRPKANRRRRAIALNSQAKWVMEISKLQQECQDLRGTLVALREAVKAAGSLRRRSMASSVRTGTELCGHLAGASWEIHAGRQRDLLSLAECENRDLKLKLETRKREARSLHRILSRRITDAKILWRDLYTSQPLNLFAPSPPVFSDTHMVFAKLLAETEAMHSKIDVMLQRIRSKVSFPIENGSFRRWEATYRPSGTTEEDTAFVEMVDVEELPFSVRHVHRAIEDMYRASEMDQFAKQNFNASDDTIMATAFYTYDLGDAEITHLRLRQVVQHYVTDTYAVFVSTFIVDSLTDVRASSTNGLLKRVQEWRIVSTSDDGTALHQTVAIMFPEFAPQSLLRPSRSTFVKRLVIQQINAWIASFARTNSKIEKLLMDPFLPSERTLVRKMVLVHKEAPQICFPTAPSIANVL